MTREEFLDDSGTVGRASGPASEHKSYLSFASFSDLDGNSWFIQAGHHAPCGAVGAIDVACLVSVTLKSESPKPSFLT